MNGALTIDAGLLPADPPYVKQGRAAPVATIVAARIDDGHPKKRLMRKHGRALLKAENPDYPVLRPDSFDMVGVVIDDAACAPDLLDIARDYEWRA